MIDNVAESLIKRYEAAKPDRQMHENVFKLIDQYVLNTPSLFSNTDSNFPGVEYDDIYDSTAITSNSMLAASIHSGLTSTAKKWFDLRPTNPALRKSDRISRWVDDVVNIMLNVFNSTESNFSQQNHETIKSLTSYGTGCMYIDMDKSNKVRFATRHLSEIYAIEDSFGNVYMAFRCFRLSARDAVNEFGSKEVSDKILHAYENGKSDQKFEFIHCVLPKKDAQDIYGDKKPIADKFNYMAYTIDLTGKKAVKRSGYIDMPYIIARFDKIPSDVYGRSPAWQLMPEILMVNKMSDHVLVDAELAARPPYALPDDGIIRELNLYPNGANMGAMSPDGRILVQPIQRGSNFSIGLEMMEQRREAIRRGYFVNQYFQKEGTPLTATEFAKRSEDELALGAPNLFRIRAEYLSKVVNRVFQLLLSNGMLPPVPQELLNETGDLSYEIEYINPIVTKQRADELDSINRAFQAALPILQINPEISDVIDGEKWLRNALEIAGAPLSVIREFDDKRSESVEEVKQRRAEQAQAQQQAELQAKRGA